MFKTLHLKSLLLLCALVVGSVSGRAEEVTDVLNRDFTGVTGTSYSPWSGKKATSDAVYAGNSAGGNSSIQLRSDKSTSGVITTTSGGKVKKISVTWNSNTVVDRTLNIYGKNSAYSAATDLYDSTKQGTLLGTIKKDKSSTTSGVVTISGDYAYIAFRSASGALYLDEVQIEWTPTHTISYSATNGIINGSDTGNNAVGSGASIAEGATVTLSATPSEGYAFSSWEVSGTGSTLSSTTTNPTTFIMGTVNATVTANFVVAGNYITVSPTTKAVTSAGEDVEFTITTDQTLDVDPTQFYTTTDGNVTTSKPAWITDALYMNGELVLTVAANTGAARTAYFRVEKGSVKSDIITINQAAQTYTIEQYTAPSTAHGTITFSPTSPVETGAEVTLTATPDEGYAFTANSWTFYKESGGDIVEDNSITVTDNIITMPAYDLYVDATFTAKATYDITCVNNPTAGGTIVSDDNAYEGKTVTITCEANTGYRLSSIVVTKTSDGSATGITLTANGDDYTFTMPAYAVTVTASYNEIYTSGTFTKNTAALTEGYYVITYDNYALKNTVSSNRFTNGSFTATNNIITNPDASIVWKIESNGNYWTIYNDAVDKYAAGTSSKNQGALIESVTDYAKWTATVSNGTFQFENLGRSNASSDSGNKWLRNNGSNGWACYASATGGALTLYKLTVLTERTITFNGNGGTFNEASTYYTQTVYDGIEATLEANKFTKSNNVFLGWSTTQNGSVEYADKAVVTATGDMTLYAVWNQLYTAMVDDPIANGTVSIDDGGSGTDAVEAVEGTEITLTYNAADGYMLDAWNVYKDGDNTVTVTVTNNKFNMPAYDVIISATFVEIPTYTLTVDNSIEGGTVSVEGDVTSAEEGTQITLSCSPSSGYIFNAWNVYKADDETTKVTVTNNKFDMPAFNVVVSASFVEIPTYTLATSITSGKHYIIVGQNSSNYYAMGLQRDSNRGGVGINVSGTTASVESSSVYEFALYGPDANGKYTIYDANTASTGYLYAASSEKNYLKTQATNDDNGRWTITFSENVASIVANGSNTRNVMRFNYNNGSPLFACYGAATQSPIYLYEKDDEATPTESKSLNSYGFATYCSQNALDFSDFATAGYSAWQITGVSGDAITFSQIKGSVPAGTGLFLMGSGSATLKSAGGTVTNTEVAGNKLEGVTADKTVATGEYYGLSGNTFVKVNAGTVPAGKALLPASVVEGSGARLTFVFEDATGISTTLNDNEQMINDGVYDLQGRRIESSMFNVQSSMLKKGLYIVNGKKVLVK